MIYAGLCGFGNRVARRGVDSLAHEVARQVLPDGGHIGRSPEIHARALAILIDARGMISAAGRGVPSWLDTAIAGMGPMLRFFCHGDGGVALFNGAKPLPATFLDALLGRAKSGESPPVHARHSGYGRLAVGDTLVLVDLGDPAPAPFDRDAHAGTLSFEMSYGRERIIVNCGSRDDGEWHDAARTTAAHSTAVVDDTNSSEIVSNQGTGRRAHVSEVTLESVDGNHWIAASHDGYLPSLGIIHRRRLYLAAGGDDLRGEDTLAGVSTSEFAIRFHLHPDVRASLVQNAAAALLRVPSGAAWRMQAVNGALSLADSIYLGDSGAARRAEQVVLSGRLGGQETVVKWALRRIDHR
jgi:uncharacterized heparinase superfamily protein